MNLYVVDFSEFYFVSIQGMAVPSRREGKFVVIVHEPEQAFYLVLYPTPSARSRFLHANLVDRFCKTIRLS